ncbi:RHS repeat-associated core domain-containing protein, partial [Xanthomonas theicola]
DASGLYYYRARYYRPEWGRFVSEDPIGLSDGFNVYAYVGGNPINFSDPFGLARFGFRPLGGGQKKFASGESPSGNSNVERAHEQLWFDDKNSENVGFFSGDGNGSGFQLCGEKGQVRSDAGHGRGQYTFFGPIYDDATMRMAVENVSKEWAKKSYCLVGQNCQNFADELRKEYMRKKNKGGN